MRPSTWTRASARSSSTSGPIDPKNKGRVSPAVRAIGTRAGGRSTWTGSCSRTTCVCCCARSTAGYSRAGTNDSPSWTSAPSAQTLRGRWAAPAPTRRCVASRRSRRRRTDTQPGTETRSRRMRRLLEAFWTTTMTGHGSPRLASSFPILSTSTRGRCRRQCPALMLTPGSRASPGRCTKPSRGSTTRACPTAVGRSCLRARPGASARHPWLSARLNP